MSLFIVFAILLTASAVALVVIPLLRQTEQRANSPIAATVMAVALPALVLAFYVGISNYTWQTGSASVGVETGPGSPSAGDLSRAVTSLEDRLKSEPNDVDGWLLLGRTYFELQNFPQARSAFARALALQPSTEAKLGVAEAEILVDRNSLTADAGRLVEEVLQQEPNHQKALFYGGLVASARRDFDTVRQRWERLLTMSPPPNVRKMLEEQLAMLPASTNPPDDPPPDAASSGGINVRVDIAADLADKIRPGAMLFLVARDPGKPGPPVAVVRQGAAEFPSLLRITDANAMLPGQSLAALEQVHLLARIANGGDPIAQPGDIFGEIQWTRSGENTQANPISILMDKVVE